MRRSELHYHLPLDRIAQHAAEPRDAARLLVFDRAAGRREHRVFRDVGEYLRPRDLLVLNDTRVIPARFFARRATGGRVEGLFLRRQDDGTWRVLLRPAARLRVGERLACDGDAIELVIEQRRERGEWSVTPDPEVDPLAWLARVGAVPLPPYIARPAPPHGDAAARIADAERYQTVYAQRPGAVAAPTAGLHFTPELLARLEAAGVRRATLTLHVGPGTFLPIECEDLRDHRMHEEWFAVPRETIAALRETRAAGGRVVAVGTTSARVLESIADALIGGTDEARAGWTGIFLYPPRQFRAVDALLTNFHLPQSTLLALVMAFAGIEPIRAAYREAVERGYRFYSYGDAMLLL